MIVFSRSRIRGAAMKCSIKQQALVKWLNRTVRSDFLSKWCRRLCASLLGALCFSSFAAHAAPSELDELRAQIEAQRVIIEKLSERLERLESNESESRAQPEVRGYIAERELHLTGEGAMGFYSTGDAGQHPNNEFLLDEARAYVEARVMPDTYFFAELNMMTREKSREKNSHRGNINMNIGELYVDFENVRQLFGGSGGPTFRVGRFEIPFGEEYMRRDAMKNPLVTHSLADFWGIDEGIELYGSVGAVSYLVALQNGGHAVGRDFESDKSITVRLGVDPTSNLHLGASYMTTGDLTNIQSRVDTDRLGELWFGNYWISDAGTADTVFSSSFWLGEGRVSLGNGHLAFLYGQGLYEDNGEGDTDIEFDYYTLEVVQPFTEKAYGALRWSGIESDEGYYLVGLGNEDLNLEPDQKTTELQQLSLGLGYRLSESLILKGEYAWIRGDILEGGRRDDENMFTLQLAYKFPQR